MVAVVAAAVAASCPAEERSAVERWSDGPDAAVEPDVAPAVADGPYGDVAAAAGAGVDVRESSY